MKPDDQSPDREWQIYYDQRCDIDRTAFEIGGRYDKLILAVSGGGFILSITFLDKIAADPPLWIGLLLVCGWGAFAVSIISQLLALRFSQEAQQHKILDLDSEFLHDRDETERTDFSAQDDTDKAIYKTRLANKFAFWSAFCGLTLISLFAATAFINPQINTIYDKSKQSEETARIESATSQKDDKGRWVCSDETTGNPQKAR